MTTFEKMIKKLETDLCLLNAYRPCVSTVGMIYLASAELSIKNAIEAIQLMEQFKDFRKDNK